MTFRYNKAEPDLMCLCCSDNGASGGPGASKVPCCAGSGVPVWVRCSVYKVCKWEVLKNVDITAIEGY